MRRHRSAPTDVAVRSQLAGVLMRDINKLVIHCSATKGSMTKVDAKEIDRWHRMRGFLSIGYHYVIKRDGTVETGRPLETVGAHAAGHNTDSIGICLIGGVAEDGKTPEDNFTDKQWAALKGLLTDLLAQFPGAEVLGHKDLPRVAKACPSFDVRKWVAKEFPNKKGKQ